MVDRLNGKRAEKAGAGKAVCRSLIYCGQYHMAIAKKFAVVFVPVTIAIGPVPCPEARTTPRLDFRKTKPLIMYRAPRHSR